MSGISQIMASLLRQAKEAEGAPRRAPAIFVNGQVIKGTVVKEVEPGKILISVNGRLHAVLTETKMSEGTLFTAKVVSASPSLQLEWLETEPGISTQQQHIRGNPFDSAVHLTAEQLKLAGFEPSAERVRIVLEKVVMLMTESSARVDLSSAIKGVVALMKGALPVTPYTFNAVVNANHDLVALAAELEEMLPLPGFAQQRLAEVSDRFFYIVNLAKTAPLSAENLQRLVSVIGLDNEARLAEAVRTENIVSREPYPPVRQILSSLFESALSRLGSGEITTGRYRLAVNIAKLDVALFGAPNEKTAEITPGRLPPARADLIDRRLSDGLAASGIKANPLTLTALKTLLELGTEPSASRLIKLLQSAYKIEDTVIGKFIRTLSPEPASQVDIQAQKTKHPYFFPDVPGKPNLPAAMRQLLPEAIIKRFIASRSSGGVQPGTQPAPAESLRSGKPRETFPLRSSLLKVDNIPVAQPETHRSLSGNIPRTVYPQLSRAETAKLSSAFKSVALLKNFTLPTTHENAAFIIKVVNTAEALSPSIKTVIEMLSEKPGYRSEFPTLSRLTQLHSAIMDKKPVPQGVVLFARTLNLPVPEKLLSLSGLKPSLMGKQSAPVAAQAELRLTGSESTQLTPERILTELDTAAARLFGELDAHEKSPHLLKQILSLSEIFRKISTEYKQAKSMLERPVNEALKRLGLEPTPLNKKIAHRMAKMEMPLTQANVRKVASVLTAHLSSKPAVNEPALIDRAIRQSHAALSKDSSSWKEMSRLDRLTPEALPYIAAVLDSLNVSPHRSAETDGFIKVLEHLFSSARAGRDKSRLKRAARLMQPPRSGHNHKAGNAAQTNLRAVIRDTIKGSVSELREKLLNLPVNRTSEQTAALSRLAGQVLDRIDMMQAANIPRDGSFQFFLLFPGAPDDRPASFEFKNRRGADGEDCWDIVIRVAPEPLGPVSVVMHKKGKNLSGEIQLERHEHEELIRKNITVLQERLSGRGYEVSRIWLELKKPNAPGVAGTDYENRLYA